MKTEHTPTPENTGKHTPTPWTYKTTVGSNHEYCTIYSEAGGGVARHVKPQDADLIVTAANSYSTLKAENERLLQMAEELQNKYAEANGKAIRLQAENEQLEKDKEKWFEVAKKRTYENEVLMETLRKDTEQIGRLQSENEQKGKRIKELEAALTRFVEFGQKHILESGDSYESAMFRQCKEALNPKQ